MIKLKRFFYESRIMVLMSLLILPGFALLSGCGNQSPVVQHNFVEHQINHQFYFEDYDASSNAKHRLPTPKKRQQKNHKVSHQSAQSTHSSDPDGFKLANHQSIGIDQPTCPVQAKYFPNNKNVVTPKKQPNDINRHEKLTSMHHTKNDSVYHALKIHQTMVHPPQHGLNPVKNRSAESLGSQSKRQEDAPHAEHGEYSPTLLFSTKETSHEDKKSH